MTLHELIERLEGATEGSRELDARIQAWEYFEDFVSLNAPDHNPYDPLSTYWIAGNGRRYMCWANKAYSRSVDAALSLIPAGWHFVRLEFNRVGIGGIFLAEVESDDALENWYGAHPNKVIALCTACLRAIDSTRGKG